MKRKIVKINEDKCNGCGVCIPNCAEGALQIIDGKVKLISDLFCDGLGACIGTCPEDAITIEEREAEEYSERKTMEENIIPSGENTIMAHLKHLKDHNEMDYYNEAIQVLKEQNIPNPLEKENKEEKMNSNHQHKSECGCPGAKTMTFEKKESTGDSCGCSSTPSELRQWPIQLHLVSPMAPYFKGADLLLAADCTAFAIGDFHNKFLKGKSIAIACPKLDNSAEIYIEKLVALIENAKINTLEVMIMEVPCCGGLLSMAKEAASRANRNIPVKKVLISLQGEILSSDWV